ncbi:hypothetical protein [Nitrosomonas sp. Nm33]|uniref:hypothetical protein n=1 Tax=Nitrosomonas sp. Nm33 TaxID=133724 RepID=UPI00115FDC5A|nr:hypothetical protein [Nitrosomonas sp. Nm33]
MPAIGLHITRTAGTSLHTAFGSKLERGQMYVCSSAIQRLRDNEFIVPGPLAVDRLLFIFGHYVHEHLVAAYPRRRVFLFTVLRDPIDRSLSNLRHINKLRADIHEQPMELAEYAATQSNTICEELLRAFPSFRDDSRPLHRCALDILDLFDFVGLPHTLPQLAEHIAQKLEVAAPEIGVENATQRNAPAQGDTAAMTILREKHSEDIALFDALRRRPDGLGRRPNKSDDAWDRFAAANPGTREEKIHSWLQHLRHYYVSEVKEFMKVEEATQLLEEVRQQHDQFTAAYRALLDPNAT